MTQETIVALVGVAGALAGVVLGWVLKRMNESAARSIERREFFSFARLLVENCIVTLEEGFGSIESLEVAASPPYRTVFPEHLTNEIAELRKRARLMDAEIAIFTMKLEQVIENLGKGMSMLHCAVKREEEADGSVSLVGARKVIEVRYHTVLQFSSAGVKVAACIWYIASKRGSLKRRLLATLHPKYKLVRAVYREQTDSSNIFCVMSDQ